MGPGRGVHPPPDRSRSLVAANAFQDRRGVDLPSPGSEPLRRGEWLKMQALTRKLFALPTASPSVRTAGTTDEPTEILGRVEPNICSVLSLKLQL